MSVGIRVSSSLKETGAAHLKWKNIPKDIRLDQLAVATTLPTQSAQVLFTHAAYLCIRRQRLRAFLERSQLTDNPKEFLKLDSAISVYVCVNHQLLSLVLV